MSDDVSARNEGGSDPALVLFRWVAERCTGLARLSHRQSTAAAGCPAPRVRRGAPHV